ncbi:hypothetical protein V2E24_02090 [Mycoplasmopsis ciconiae]|uniref:Uncharacterized protein n=1 Tax=Mycoplasmopsis ciconiae TaxID=561067 RepID=A0ABU7MM60_9BACT|nr:hypothetical protein [Mycoplasmopsis ciconiae]
MFTTEIIINVDINRIYLDLIKENLDVNKLSFDIDKHLLVLQKLENKHLKKYEIDYEQINIPVALDILSRKNYLDFYSAQANKINLKSLENSVYLVKMPDNTITLIFQMQKETLANIKEDLASILTDFLEFLTDEQIKEFKWLLYNNQYINKKYFNFKIITNQTNKNITSVEQILDNNDTIVQVDEFFEYFEINSAYISEVAIAYSYLFWGQYYYRKNLDFYTRLKIMNIDQISLDQQLNTQKDYINQNFIVQIYNVENLESNISIPSLINQDLNLKAKELFKNIKKYIDEQNISLKNNNVKKMLKSEIIAIWAIIGSALFSTAGIWQVTTWIQDKAIENNYLGHWNILWILSLTLSLIIMLGALIYGSFKLFHIFKNTKKINNLNLIDKNNTQILNKLNSNINNINSNDIAQFNINILKLKKEQE